jgi:putative tryptophan/tyrosine transport system substrate-binding protein
VILLSLLEDTTLRRSTIGLFITLALALLVAPLMAQAQQPATIRRIGMLSSGVVSPERTRYVEAFLHSLRELGWVEGQNLAFAYRSAEGQAERLPDLAAELVRLRVEVIVTVGGDRATRAAKEATSTIPIVMGGVGDPVQQGFIASLARPGGNLTGLAILDPELSGKRLELLKEAVPQASRIAVLRHAPGPVPGVSLSATQAAAQALGVELHIVEVHRPAEIEGAFAAMQQAGAGALLVLTDSLVLEPHRHTITALALQSRLPAMYPWRMYVVDAGGLMSYGVDLPDVYRRAAYYTDRLLKGAKPADLPVEQPTKFELVINLKTAQALGLTIPPSLLFQADEIIR